VIHEARHRLPAGSRHRAEPALTRDQMKTIRLRFLHHRELRQVGFLHGGDTRNQFVEIRRGIRARILRTELDRRQRQHAQYRHQCPRGQGQIVHARRNRARRGASPVPPLLVLLDCRRQRQRIDRVHQAGTPYATRLLLFTSLHLHRLPPLLDQLDRRLLEAGACRRDQTRILLRRVAVPAQRHRHHCRRREATKRLPHNGVWVARGANQEREERQRR
jgi:hypothetical protein